MAHFKRTSNSKGTSSHCLFTTRELQLRRLQLFIIAYEQMRRDRAEQERERARQQAADTDVQVVSSDDEDE